YYDLLSCFIDHRPLPSFPTRRSSDLGKLSPHAFSQIFKKLKNGVGFLSVERFIFDHPSQSAPIQQSVQRGHLKRSYSLQHPEILDRKSTRLNSSHVKISYAVVSVKKR